MSEEKGNSLSKVFCGLSTALFVLSEIVSPVCMLIWLGAATQMQQDTETMDMMLICVACCFGGLIISLILGIVAKVKSRKSKWALVCIILSAVFLVADALAAFFFIFAASQYHYYV